jgi:hypothetical protein
MRVPDAPNASKSSSLRLKTWERAQDAPDIFTSIMQDKAKRGPNGLWWGETPEDFFRIDLDANPHSQVVVWPRSMVQALGEDRERKNDWRDDEGEPRLVAPWPVLMLRRDEEGKSSPAGDGAGSKADSDAPADPPSDPSTASVSDVSDSSGLPAAKTDAEHEDANAHPADAGKASTDDSCNGTAPESKDAQYEEDKVHHDPTIFLSIPKLEEFIPEQHFPDVLLVHDKYDLVEGRHVKMRSSADATAAPMRYKRVFPVLPKAPATDDAAEEAPSAPHTAAAAAEKVAHLELTPGALLGSGHHSYVYRAALTLPPPLTAARSRSRTGQVHVAAKLAMPHAEARRLLKNEARVYARMPRHLQEAWSGFGIISNVLEYPFPLGPAAPKFYGWYEPEDVPEEREKKRSEPEREDEAKSASGKEDVEEQAPKPVRQHKPSGILLLEECGEPIEPGTFTFNDK